MNLTVRVAESHDLVSIVEIYNEAIAQRGATADLDPISVESRQKWLDEHSPTQHPIYVAVANGEVVGWCSLSPYRPGRQALRFTAEISYYVKATCHRRGVGSKLVQQAIDDCPRLGIKTLFAILLDVNEASIAILTKFGFVKWGHLPNVADIDGKECGHLYYGLRVG